MSIKAIESNLTPIGTAPHSARAMAYPVARTVEERRELRNMNDWLEAQDEAEVSFLITEMSMRNNRYNRLSAYG